MGRLVARISIGLAAFPKAAGSLAGRHATRREQIARSRTNFKRFRGTRINGRQRLDYLLRNSEQPEDVMVALMDES